MSNGSERVGLIATQVTGQLLTASPLAGQCCAARGPE
jgi:hypothetical protein